MCMVFNMHDIITKHKSEVLVMESLDLNKNYTYEEYESWEGKWELIDGVPYSISPAPNTEHQRISGEIYFALRSFFKKANCQVFYAPFDVRFSETDQLDTKGLKGAPDLVIEILSPPYSTERSQCKIQTI